MVVELPLPARHDHAGQAVAEDIHRGAGHVEQGVDPEDEAALAQLARENQVELELSGTVTIGGHDVTTAIRSAEIDRIVDVLAQSIDAATA